MSKPTAKVRKAVYERDGHRCVSCGSTSLTFQHRVSEGMGGNPDPCPPENGLTLCMVCNQACEASMQDLALARGWKVKRHFDPAQVPVFYPAEYQWYRLESTRRVPLTDQEAFYLGCETYGDLWREFRAREVFADLMRGNPVDEGDKK